jgi:hypothetical protein
MGKVGEATEREILVVDTAGYSGWIAISHHTNVLSSLII